MEFLLTYWKGFATAGGITGLAIIGRIFYWLGTLYDKSVNSRIEKAVMNASLIIQSDLNTMDKKLGILERSDEERREALHDMKTTLDHIRDNFDSMPARVVAEMNRRVEE